MEQLLSIHLLGIGVLVFAQFAIIVRNGWQHRQTRSG